MRSDGEEGRTRDAHIIELLLDEGEATELVALLDAAIADLSPEIADTDNAQYRAMLRQRRDLLRSIRGKLSGELPVSDVRKL
jgi:hypothetical protein